MNRLTRCWQLSPLVLAAGLILLCALLVRSVAAQDRIIDPDVEKILRERLAVLEEAAKLRHDAYRTGQTSFAGTLAANQAVLEAKLELAKNAMERVQVREEILKNAEALEKAAETLVQSSEAPRMDLLTARANRLRAEADLLLERKSAAR